MQTVIKDHAQTINTAHKSANGAVAGCVPRAGQGGGSAASRWVAAPEQAPPEKESQGLSEKAPSKEAPIGKPKGGSLQQALDAVNAAGSDIMEAVSSAGRKLL